MVLIYGLEILIQILKDLFNIRKEVQKLLKDRFYSFMNGLCARIQSAYEVRTIRGEVADFDALSKRFQKILAIFPKKC